MESVKQLKPEDRVNLCRAAKIFFSKLKQMAPFNQAGNDLELLREQFAGLEQAFRRHTYASASEFEQAVGSKPKWTGMNDEELMKMMCSGMSMVDIDDACRTDIRRIAAQRAVETSRGRRVTADAITHEIRKMRQSGEAGSIAREQQMQGTEQISEETQMQGKGKEQVKAAGV